MPTRVYDTLKYDTTCEDDVDNGRTKTRISLEDLYIKKCGPNSYPVITAFDKPNAKKGVKAYYLWENIFDLDGYIAQEYQNKRFDTLNMYEIVPGSVDRKMYYDIEIEDKPNVPKEHQNLDFAYDLVMNLVVETNKHIPFDPLSDVIILESHRVRDDGSFEKISFHVIIDSYRMTLADTITVYNAVTNEGLNPQYISYVDKAVYKSNQAFRMVFNSKINVKHRLSHLTEWKYSDKMGSKYIQYECAQDDDDDFDYEFTEREKQLNDRFLIRHTLVQYTPCCKLISINKSEASTHKYTKTEIESMDKVMRVFKSKYPSMWCQFEPSMSKDDCRIDLTRTHPGKCEIHHRVHENDNAFIYVNKNGYGYFKCYRGVTDGTLELGNIQKQSTLEPRDDQQVLDPFEDYGNDNDNIIKPGLYFGDTLITESIVDHVVEIQKAETKRAKKRFDVPENLILNKPFEQYISRVINQRYLPRNLDTSGTETLVIYSPLGTGKTTTLANYIDHCDHKRILIITPRRTYAQSISGDYERMVKSRKFECYLDYPREKSFGLYEFDNLIIQVESLFKLIQGNDLRLYDCIILDEVESILTQLGSMETMGDKVFDIVDEFEALIEEAKMVIAADAFVSMRTIDVLTNLGRKPSILKNVYKQIPRNAIDTGDLKHFHQEILDKLNDGKKLYSVWGSKTKMLEFVSVLKEKHINYLAYYAETSESQKKMLKDVNNIWSDESYRIVLVTSTITVGVNYDTEGTFDSLFVYGSSCGSIVRDLFQGTMRVRNFNSNEMYYCNYSRRASTKFRSHISSSIYMKNILNDMNEYRKRVKSMAKDIGFSSIRRAPKWYRINICNNIRERNLSSLHFRQVFDKYLAENNYTSQLLEEYEVDHLELPELKNITEQDYYTIPSTPDEIKYAVQRYRDRDETEEDRRILLRYESDRMIERNTEEELKAECFVLYASKKTREYIVNMYNEKSKGSSDILKDELNKSFDINVTSRSIYTSIIEGLNNILGIRNSGEEAIIKPELDTTLWKYIKPRLDDIRKCTGCRISGKVDSKSNQRVVIMKNHSVIMSYLKSIYKKYNGCNVKPITTGKKEAGRIYSYRKDAHSVFKLLRGPRISIVDEFIEEKRKQYVKTLQ